MVFHFGNAYDDGDCTHFDVVLHDGDRIAELASEMRGERRPNQAVRSHATHVTLDYARRQLRTAHLLGATEFPRVMPQVVSARHRKLALVSSDRGSKTDAPDTVNLVDTDSGKADSYRFGAGWQVEEHVLVPLRNARSETDGYLMGVAQDTGAGVSVLSVFDAAHVGAGPVALARLPYRTPHCFHGNFLPA
jgi:all-trans-8'-apo-beta-carotenal 15,15'-oxygenase